MNRMMGRMGKLSLAVFVFATGGGHAMADSNYSLHSPDNRIAIEIHVAKQVTYDISLNGKLLMKNSTLAINVEGKTLGENPQVKGTKKDSADKILEPVVRQKFEKIRERYNELRLEMDGGYAVVFRAYPEGVAYRIETSLGQGNVKVYSEEVNIGFAGDYTVYYPQE